MVTVFKGVACFVCIGLFLFGLGAIAIGADMIISVSTTLTAFSSLLLLNSKM